MAVVTVIDFSDVHEYMTYLHPEGRSFTPGLYPRGGRYPIFKFQIPSRHSEISNLLYKAQDRFGEISTQYVTQELIGKLPPTDLYIDNQGKLEIVATKEALETGAITFKAALPQVPALITDAVLNLELFNQLTPASQKDIITDPISGEYFPLIDDECFGKSNEEIILKYMHGINDRDLSVISSMIDDVLSRSLPRFNSDFVHKIDSTSRFTIVERLETIYEARYRLLLRERQR